MASHVDHDRKARERQFSRCMVADTRTGSCAARLKSGRCVQLLSPRVLQVGSRLLPHLEHSDGRFLPARMHAHARSHPMDRCGTRACVGGPVPHSGAHSALHA